MKAVIHTNVFDPDLRPRQLPRKSGGDIGSQTEFTPQAA